MDKRNASPGGDLIDSVVGLADAGTLYATRHTREKVALATQGSYALFFDPASGGLTIQERLLVAYYACLLSKCTILGNHYHSLLLQNQVDAATLESVTHNSLDDIESGRLAAILVFTGKLILKPIEGDKAAALALQSAGLSTPDIITLAQLIAFLSYQIRLVAGLQAMKALELSS